MRYSIYKMEPAGSVVEELASDISQLITTTPMARFVASCVPHATRRWVSSGMTPHASVRQQLISRIHQHEQYWASVTGHSTQTRG